MPLTIRTQLGACDIVAMLGARRMGEVYRAKDLRLDRDVALKVLPEAFARDAAPRAPRRPTREHVTFQRNSGWMMR